MPTPAPTPSPTGAPTIAPSPAPTFPRGFLARAGYRVEDALRWGIVDLEYAGFTVADALAGNVTDLRAAGFNAKDAVDANVTNLKDAGFTAEEAWAGGVPSLADAGFNVTDVAASWWTPTASPTPMPSAVPTPSQMVEEAVSVATTSLSVSLATLSSMKHAPAKALRGLEAGMASELDLPPEQVSVAKTAPDLLARRLQLRDVGRRLQTDLLAEYVIISPSDRVADLHAWIETNMSATLGAAIAVALEAKDPVAFANVSVEVRELHVELAGERAPAATTSLAPATTTSLAPATTTPAPADGLTWASAAYSYVINRVGGDRQAGRQAGRQGGRQAGRSYFFGAKSGKNFIQNSQKKCKIRSVSD